MEGNIDKAKGKAKQALGDITEDQDLKRQGKMEEAGGKMKEFAGRIKEKIDHAIDDAVGDRNDKN